MKYLKNFKIFESTFTDSDVEKIKELFYDLSDNGFFVDVNKCVSSVINFPESNEIDIGDILDFAGDDVDAIIVDIEGYGNNFNFNISDIIDVINVANGYIKDVLGFELLYIYANGVRLYKYYKSPKYLPKNKILDCLSITFIKK